ncbi:hypothetical protein HOP50_01g04940 [Chloropicon primus]|uniref:Uncharacterized protein n=2 Tax=Chloropicon primus TaxID=1764295 RepID=A0A5B8MBZ6_9CHLO|nr:hypothetical protein A3770_01p05060 [Chloropicon primus]UPQ97203.1 hypothetical protein HOP50_01g04940 [Chloropicon primus]|eukprot:QDZ17988.1 hypothetical protein A3770_01p05060 [Chloropicon primus]
MARKETGQDLIGDLLKDLGMPGEPTTTAAAPSGKENSSRSKIVADLQTSLVPEASMPSTAGKVPHDYGRVDLAPFFDSPLVGGPLSEVSLEQKKKEGKRQRGKKQKGAAEGNGNQAENPKKKDKARKKERRNSGSDQKDKDGRRGSLWAGSAFLKSPAPEELPMPSPSLLAGIPREICEAPTAVDTTAELKKMLNLDGGGCAATTDNSDAVATNDLRRMLQIS